MTQDVPQLTIRLGILAFVCVILQSAVVGQLHIFGVPADLTPLVAMAVGLLLGSTTGAAFGFGIGLLLDLALLQTLGVSSLLLTVIGYGSGRLRELRDPAHGLVPMGVGAAAAAAFVIGSAMMQFLLGFDVPISPLLVRDIVLGILIDTLIAIPVHNLVRRLLLNFLPDDPRRRRRRAYTTGGLSPLSRS